MAKTTKQLAKELGFLRKRQLADSPAREIKRRNHSSSQIFSYLIVIDFESTCWENEKSSCQEIIEFPAVLLNTKNGLIESEFHYYLHPTERPVLSEFCKQLTGIKQELVDNGIPLYNCLRKFTGWLNKLKEEKGILFANDQTVHGNDNFAAFVTWSDWDLGVCLHYETKRKQISKPTVLNRWIDLRATYKNFYSRKPDGLSGALKDLGIIFDGREHSGLDDARNTAKLAWRMINDGCIMTITKTIKTNPVSSSNVSHLKNENDSVHAAVNNTVSNYAHIAVTTSIETVSEKCVVIPFKESQLIKKKILSDSTNIYKAVTKDVTSDIVKCKNLSQEPKDSLKSKSSKLPVFQSDWKKQFPKNNIADSVHSKKNVSTIVSDISHVALKSANLPVCVTPKNTRYLTPAGVPEMCKKSTTFTAIKPMSCSVTPRTPSVVQSHLVQTAFKTPRSKCNTSMKRTLPLCSCGRRSKRRLVQNQGPNQGRWFFTCSMSSYSCNTKPIVGCKFFQWEIPMLSPYSSV